MLWEWVREGENRGRDRRHGANHQQATIGATKAERFCQQTGHKVVTRRKRFGATRLKKKTLVSIGGLVGYWVVRSDAS